MFLSYSFTCMQLRWNKNLWYDTKKCYLIWNKYYGTKIKVFPINDEEGTLVSLSSNAFSMHKTTFSQKKQKQGKSKKFIVKRVGPLLFATKCSCFSLKQTTQKEVLKPSFTALKKKWHFKLGRFLGRIFW